MAENLLSRISATMLLEIMAEGAIFVDTEGKIRVWNKSMQDMTGHSSSEVLGKTTEWLRAPECIGANRINSLLATNAPDNECITRCECKIIAKNGEKIPVMVNARLLNDSDGKALGILQTLTDIRPLISLKQELAAMASKISSEASFNGITGRSAQIQKVFRLIGLAAESEASVMILGESGTGKELVASAIHNISQRQNKPFVCVNCGAIPENLLESELFGHEKGAFTGAIKSRTGRFEAANKGTIFLDEIGDITPAMQVKLLRVLQSGEVARLGSESTFKVNIRVIAATNKNLQKEVREGRFREDLYYRLKVFPIVIPPLRDRPDDIPVLVRHFINKFSASTGRLINGLSHYALQHLKKYSWPGNVRELENAIEYAFVVCQSHLISLEDLPAEITAPDRVSEAHPKLQPVSMPTFTGSPNTLRSKDALIKLLVESDWNKAEAGRRLGVSRTAVWKWMKKHKIPMKPEN
jgi:PAS domain S-box-containing protein